jgi:hypothetical protein
MTYDDKPTLCSGKGNVEASRISQESETALRIGTDAAKYDALFLSALESINRAHFHSFFTECLATPR